MPRVVRFSLNEKMQKLNEAHELGLIDSEGIVAPQEQWRTRYPPGGVRYDNARMHILQNHLDANGRAHPRMNSIDDFVGVQFVNRKKFGNVTVNDLCGVLDSIRDNSVTLTGYDQALVPHPTASTVGKLLGKHDSGKELYSVCEMVHHLVNDVNTQTSAGKAAELSNAKLDVLKKHNVKWAGQDGSNNNGKGNHRYKDEFKAGNGAVLLMMAGIELPPSLEVSEDLTHTYPENETAFAIAKRTFESITYQMTTVGACVERDSVFVPTFVGDGGKKWEEREDIPKGSRPDFEQFVKEKGGCKECKRSGVKDCRLSKHNLTVSHNNEAREVKKMHSHDSQSGKKYSKSPSHCSLEELREQEEECAKIRRRGGEASIDVRCWDHHMIDDQGILSKVIAGVLPIENSPYRNQEVFVNRQAIMRKMKLLLASGVDLSAVNSVDELDMESLQMFCAYSGLPMDSNESEIVDGHHVFGKYNVLLSDDGAEYEFATAKGMCLTQSFKASGDGLQGFIERNSQEARLNTFLLKSVHMMTHRAKDWIASGKMTDVKLPWKIDEERNYIIIDVQEHPRFRRFLCHGRLLETDVTSPQQEEAENANVNLPLVPMPVHASNKRTVDQISSDEEDVVDHISSGDVEDDCLHLATQQQTGNERVSVLQNGARLIYLVPTQHQPLNDRQAPRRLIYRAPTQHQPLNDRQNGPRLIYSAPTQHQPLIDRQNGPRLIYSAPTQHQPLIDRQAPRRLIYRARTQRSSLIDGQRPFVSP